MTWTLEHIGLRFSPATQVFGLAFSEPRHVHLPDGKAYQYVARGVRYEQYYGFSASIIATVGPVDIDLGFAPTLGSRKSAMNAWARLGSSICINDLFELRALAGYQATSIFYDRKNSEERHRPSAAIEVSAPFSFLGGLTLAVSTTFLHDAMVSLGIEFGNNPIQKKIIREESESAFTQAQHTFNDVKAAVSLDAIMQSADTMKGRDPAERHLRALIHAVFYMTVPNYPWEGRRSFKELIAKARGEAVFANSLDDREESKRLIMEIDQFYERRSHKLIRELSEDKLGITHWLESRTVKIDSAHQDALMQDIDSYRHLIMQIGESVSESLLKNMTGRLDALKEKLKGVVP